MTLPKTNIWARLQYFADFHSHWALGLTLGMVILAVGTVSMAFILMPEPQLNTSQIIPGKKTTKTTTPQSFYSPLTGVAVADEAATKRQVTGIMIENSPSARPQSGLKNAGIVFEAIAEGGITRLACLYQEDRPGLIGPVRSLRPYYLDWMAAYDAAISHVGGSYYALQEVRNGSYKDIDQFFNGGSYWRATDRTAPHNVYTNFDKLDELNARKDFTSSNFTSFPRKLDSPSAAPNANQINITVSSATYNVSYIYDKAANKYARSLGGAPHNDREAGQITPKVVIAMKVPTTLGFEDGYREQMTTSGHNTAYIFQDGIAVEGIWRKTGRKAPIEFYDKTGKPIYLNAGQTWITVVAPQKSVTWQ